jgi:hypothetical protein
MPRLPHTDSPHHSTIILKQEFAAGPTRAATPPRLALAAGSATGRAVLRVETTLLRSQRAPPLAFPRQSPRRFAPAILHIVAPTRTFPSVAVSSGGNRQSFPFGRTFPSVAVSGQRAPGRSTGASECEGVHTVSSLTPYGKKVCIAIPRGRRDLQRAQKGLQNTLKKSMHGGFLRRAQNSAQNFLSLTII